MEFDLYFHFFRYTALSYQSKAHNIYNLVYFQTKCDPRGGIAQKRLDSFAISRRFRFSTKKICLEVHEMIWTHWRMSVLSNTRLCVLSRLENSVSDALLGVLKHYSSVNWKRMRTDHLWCTLLHIAHTCRKRVDGWVMVSFCGPWFYVSRTCQQLTRSRSCSQSSSKIYNCSMRRRNISQIKVPSRLFLLLGCAALTCCPGVIQGGDFQCFWTSQTKKVLYWFLT